MTTPRWLSDDELTAWLRLRAVTMLLPAAIDGQLKRDSGLTEFEYYVLAMLSDASDRRLTLSDLASRTNSSLSRLSHVVRRLGEAGWVTKATCPDDGRSTFAVLTDAGMALVESAAPGHVEEVRRRVFDTLSDAEREGLSVALERILSTLDPAHHLTRDID
ncbi:MarR family winged helix-turn-helix transcriptional regulator [Mycetocola reblochoni]|uniref:Transcriptional regulator, MarR family n=2 Tax=Mycetocola reblochoni TaxID=331618 RepID=A0A1R4JUI7_9MICO|nr:MarR family transcriptional regulator [Mycetocola reblochoni]RLP68442.1 MarR family transcriptional regulator [Mycetocola reblochoni]SJN35921.1 Transcriptional regulator, MarR family [Mycetocola reblochoni REB411]